VVARTGVTGDGPTTAYARTLLASFGADLRDSADSVPHAVVRLDDAPDPAEDWAASGAMTLTRRADGPPRSVPANPAGAVRAALAVFAALCPQGTRPLPGPGLRFHRYRCIGNDIPW
jgi:hypothetical protein